MAPAPPEISKAADETLYTSEPPREFVSLSATHGPSQLMFSQDSSFLRKDWKIALPNKFNIGSVPSLSSPILDQNLFENFAMAAESGVCNGDRRGLLSIIAMAGWGKTFALDLLAKLTVVARRKASGWTSSGGDDFAALSEVLVKMNNNEHVKKLCRYVPLAITLNSVMSLGRKPDGEDSITWFSNEIAKRLVYAYFADTNAVDYVTWEGKVKREGGSFFCAPVLECLHDLTSTIIDDPILLILIDEPDKGKNAPDLVSALAPCALLQPWKPNGRDKSIECCVVVSALEQHWLSSEMIASGRPITVLRLDPPKDKEVVTALTMDLANKTSSTTEDEVEEAAIFARVAKYITALASGHWRTIATMTNKVKESKQWGIDEMRGSVGWADVYVPLTWQKDATNIMAILEEVLAHAIVGSKLIGMEPIHDGTAWQAVTKGVILQYLGLGVENTIIEPMVPMLIVLRLAVQNRKSNSMNEELCEAWEKQNYSKRRDTLLMNVLISSRFVLSRKVSSEIKSHELYENMAAQFILLQWDARFRIDKAVERRWARAQEDLMVIPKSKQQKELDDSDPYQLKRVEKLRDSTNMAWIRSLNLSRNEVAGEAPSERPNLWLVAPSKITDEAELRLCIFRGAVCCTESRGCIQVLPPNPQDAEHHTCDNKLWNRKARLISNEELAPGSVIEPAYGNEGFDSLTVLRKVSGDGSVFALVENKFEKASIGIGKVKEKLEVLTKKYRGILWVDPTSTKPSIPSQIQALQLPLLKESDIVWVVLADKGFTNNLPEQVKDELGMEGAFQGHVLLTTSRNFFGPSFGKLGILDKN